MVTSDDPGADFDAARLGQALRSARERRGISVRGLARELGCSASLISQVERGINSPSVGLLYNLSARLDVSVDSLLDRDAQPAGAGAPTAPGSPAATGPGFRLLRTLPPSAQPQVQRQDRRQAVSFANGVRWERLTTTSEGHPDFLEIVYPPGSSSTEDGTLAAHAGEEYGVVLAGELQIRFEDESVALRAGDSIQFDSRRPHRFDNSGGAEARAVWLVRHPDA